MLPGTKKKKKKKKKRCGNFPRYNIWNKVQEKKYVQGLNKMKDIFAMVCKTK